MFTTNYLRADNTLPRKVTPALKYLPPLSFRATLKPIALKSGQNSIEF